MVFISFYIMQIVNCLVLCLKERRKIFFLNLLIEFTFLQGFQKIPFIKYFIMENFKFTQKFQYILLKAKDLIKKQTNVSITSLSHQKTNPKQFLNISDSVQTFPVVS